MKIIDVLYPCNERNRKACVQFHEAAVAIDKDKNGEELEYDVDAQAYLIFNKDMCAYVATQLCRILMRSADDPDSFILGSQEGVMEGSPSIEFVLDESLDSYAAP